MRRGWKLTVSSRPVEYDGLQPELTAIPSLDAADEPDATAPADVPPPRCSTLLYMLESDLTPFYSSPFRPPLLSLFVSPTTPLPAALACAPTFLNI